MVALRLGPSSNTVLEPVTYALLREHPSATAHFSRFKVTEIGLGQAALGQFDDGNILASAKLLSDARCDVIAWNGTSASWLGFDRDERLVARIEFETGIRAATCVLGYRELFGRFGVERVGLVTPYTSDVQQQIAVIWGGAGFMCVAEQHCGLSENFAFATVDEARIDAMCRSIVASGCDAVAILCTNMRGAAVAARLERETGVLVFDSVAVTLWASLRAAGADTRALSAWGRLFSA